MPAPAQPFAPLDLPSTATTACVASPAAAAAGDGRRGRRPTAGDPPDCTRVVAVAAAIVEVLMVGIDLRPSREFGLHLIW